VSQEKALHEDKLREADRLDPSVDHRSDDYDPDTRAADSTTAPAYDETGRVDSTTTDTTATTGPTATTAPAETTGTPGTTGTTRVDEQGRPVDEHGRPIEDPSEPGGTHRAP
jgi:hypothetical protein